jgi:hypothetical protein
MTKTSSFAISIAPTMITSVFLPLSNPNARKVKNIGFLSMIAITSGGKSWGFVCEYSPTTPPDAKLSEEEDGGRVITTCVGTVGGRINARIPAYTPPAIASITTSVIVNESKNFFMETPEKIFLITLIFPLKNFCLPCHYAMLSKNVQKNLFCKASIM